MLKKLPLEVLESLCFYVKVEDLVNFWDVIGIEGSESFWRKICEREGYKKIMYENSLWKNVFLQNTNWLTKRYVKRTYKLEKNGGLQGKELLLGKHLVVNNCAEESLIWELSSSPNLVQNLGAKSISHKGNKLLTYNLSEIAVYSYNSQIFNKLYELPVKLPFNFLKFCSFTEDYLVTYDKNTSCIRIVDLREVTESSLVISETMSRFFSLALSSNLLFILTLEESNYKVKRFNLMDKVWLQDLVLFQSAAMIGVPQLETSPNLVVSWSNLLEAPGITPVKVFTQDGKLIVSLPLTSCMESSESEEISPKNNILWMIVDLSYLIFSTSKTTVSIWSPKNLNYINTIPKEDQLHNGQKVVSSSLLVLSYSYCFKVINFKKSVYLYEVLLNNQCSLSSFESVNFVANEYFYIQFQYVVEKEDNTKISTKEMLPSASSLCFKHASKDISNKICLVNIYDFTGTYSS